MQKSLFFILILAGVVGLSGCGLEAPGFVSLSFEPVGEGTILPSSGTRQYEQGTLVEIEAVPAQGWEFSHWAGEVSEATAPQTAVLADRDKIIQAVFLPNVTGEILEGPGGLITQRANGAPIPLRANGASDIEFIMIHAMSDAAVNPSDPYRIERMRAIFDEYGVESHYVIDRRGQIYQFLEDVLVGRHAGLGTWQGDPRLTNNMNMYAIGIELMGIGTEAEMNSVIGAVANSRIKPSDRGYTDAQYQALESLVEFLQERYQIPKENIIGHDDYAPGRKWDPGILFDWGRL
ncbi:MAG: N-acetylmuramoyl-L-alanine amidase [Firmicutes bacterium]|nr:N-acetylmuramoyl-L-alanine amidase [Bacillota bacterium]